MSDPHATRVTVFSALLLAAGLAQPALAQSSCTSDGQQRPAVLVERFINADCATCWTDPATPPAVRGAVALDWVLPGGQGEDAPLSAVATRDALKRLQALATAPPAGSLNLRTPVQGRAGALRVAHGLPVSGYIGASIAFSGTAGRAAGQPWTGWLALVETLPVGTEGSPVPRNLVRNLVQTQWDGRNQLSKQERFRFIESRSMDVPAGTNTDRLRVIGWVQDAQGRIVAAAQSRCAGK
ncbi:MAG: hypothetical protein Q8M93_23810 [Polaromonas sp.]|uniref:hypothetical protein n=1 Tax=Polaromonas sp. TaxID=1869339 RepID=UPI0027310B22|nr:hypothetical protein [Polaromonas sp.]MDP2448349.1 hypothetical protein [Polaromonas sp.]MDP3249975.1 hypothetical protein [Polaromonas sp.]MDP3757020.1 hypothetical protein [Polaromonas sp.]